MGDVEDAGAGARGGHAVAEGRRGAPEGEDVEEAVEGTVGGLLAGGGGGARGITVAGWAAGGIVADGGAREVAGDRT